jgi:hypothetical protein
VPAFAQARERCADHIRALEARRDEIGLALADLRRVHTLLAIKSADNTAK